MVYVELPPGTAQDQVSKAPRYVGREKLEPRRAWRRDKVLEQLIDPGYVGETVGLLEQQRCDIHKAFCPRNEWQDWLVSTIATIMLRINRSERIERKLRDWASYRAFDFWEEDQQLAVATIAVKLPKEPAKVVRKLRETPAGIDWLLARWQRLARVDAAAWTDEQRDLAAQLSGHDAAGDSVSPELVEGQIAALEILRERVVGADAIIRGLVEADLHDDGVAGLARLRRYVRSLQRQLKWYVDQFHVEHPDRWDDPRRRPAIEGRGREEWRPKNPNHFEGEVEPRPVVTPEPAAVAAPEVDETKPLRPVSAPRIDETKPFSPAPAPSSPRIEPPVFVHDYSNETGRHHSRPGKAGEPSREYTRRQRAARRRSNLVLTELT